MNDNIPVSIHLVFYPFAILLGNLQTGFRTVRSEGARKVDLQTRIFLKLEKCGSAKSDFFLVEDSEKSGIARSDFFLVGK